VGQLRLLDVKDRHIRVMNLIIRFRGHLPPFYPLFFSVNAVLVLISVEVKVAECFQMSTVDFWIVYP
jgi:hypothetical protein